VPGLHTLDTVDQNMVFDVIERTFGSEIHLLHCYSRRPMRQLLRYVASNRGGMWWISEHEGANVVAPDTIMLSEHLKLHLPSANDLVVIESLDWFVGRSGADETLAMLQSFDRLAREQGFTVVFPVEPLAMEKHVWARIRSLAPHLPTPMDDVTNGTARTEDSMLLDKTNLAELDEHGGTASRRIEHPAVIHLTSLPEAGFNHTVLGKRMLQWKRMGFDLTTLEPAMAMNDFHQAHTLYTEIESQIKLGVDALRRLAEHRELFTVSERERFDYRLMNLIDVQETADSIEGRISSR
jgi:hypothetical protein